MARQRKLLFFVTEDWYFVSHRLPLAIAAREAGFDVTIVTRVRAHGEIIRAAGLRLIPFENFRSGINPLVEIGTLLRVIRLWLELRPDVAHHVAMKPVLYGSIAARIARTPRVINAFGGMGWLFASKQGGARWLKPIVRGALAWVLRNGIALVQNPDDERQVAELGVPRRRICRIPGAGVDLTRFQPRSEATDVPLVVLPARLLWDKGVGEFVAAARILKTSGISARFALAGMPDPVNPSSIPEDQVEAWVREGIVEHLGWVDDMPSILAQSAIVCLPSYYGEGIPKALIEGAASARAIVTCDMPGCREIVRHGENGLLVPPRDAEALAAALRRLLLDTQLREKMGARGRIRAEEEFGLQSIVRQTLALYEATDADSRQRIRAERKP